MPISRILQDFHTLQHTYTHQKSHLQTFAHSTQVYHHLSSLERCVHYSHMVFTEISSQYWAMVVRIKPMELNMLCDNIELYGSKLNRGNQFRNYRLQIVIIQTGADQLNFQFEI